MLRMPSGIYPEVAFPRIVVIAQTPGPGGQGRRGRRHAADRGGRSSIVLGVVRVRSKSVRGLPSCRVDFAPGTDMIQALNDVRARMAEVGAQLPPGTTTITERQTPSVFPDHLVRRHRRPRPVGAHDYAYLRSAAPDQPHPGRLVRHRPGGRHPGDLWSRSTRRPWWRPTSRSPTWPTGSAKEHRLKAVGRLDRGSLQYQVLADTLAIDPLDLENVVIVEKNGQSIRLRDLGRS